MTVTYILNYLVNTIQLPATRRPCTEIIRRRNSVGIYYMKYYNTARVYISSVRNRLKKKFQQNYYFDPRRVSIGIYIPPPPPVTQCTTNILYSRVCLLLSSMMIGRGRSFFIYFSFHPDDRIENKNTHGDTIQRY